MLEAVSLGPAPFLICVSHFCSALTKCSPQQLEEGRLLDSVFQRSLVLGLIGLGAVGRQSIMAGTCGLSLYIYIYIKEQGRC